MLIKKTEIFRYLLIAFLLSLLYTKILFFPLIAYQVQPFEFLFILLLAISVFQNYPRPKLPKTLYLFLLFPLLHLLIHLDLGVALESIGTLYLIAFLLLVPWFFDKVEINSKYYMSVGIALLIANAILAGALYYYGNITSYVYVYPGYPYLGDVVRTQGFNATPSQMSSLAAIPLAYHFFIKKVHPLLLIGLLITLFSTLSKEMAPLFAVIGVFLWFKNKWLRSLSLTGIMLGTVTLTFFVIADQIPENIRPDIFDPNPYLCFGNWCAYPTPYFHLFRAAVQGFLEHPIKGLGMGNFYDYTLMLKEIGGYPEKITSVECHDIYWGNLSQFGIFYLPVFSGFVFFIRKKIQQLDNHKYQLFFTVLCIYYLIEGLIISNIHFRHIWIMLGFLILISEKNKAK